MPQQIQQWDVVVGGLRGEPGNPRLITTSRKLGEQKRAQAKPLQTRRHGERQSRRRRPTTNVTGIPEDLLTAHGNERVRLAWVARRRQVNRSL
ncbi:MAG: hypothetical protein WCG47_18385 [Dermatophilaceae bacterium]